MRINPSAPIPPLAVADPPGKLGLLGLRDKLRPVVDEDEIVAPAVHLIKRDVLRFSSSCQQCSFPRSAWTPSKNKS